MIVKKILIIAFIVIVAAVSVLAIFGSVAGSNIELLKVSDIHIPEKIDQDKLFGLFFFDANGNLVSAQKDLDKVPYDPAKPTIIHIHGQQMDKGYKGFDPFDNPQGTVKAGYNYGVFIWSQLSDISGIPDAAKFKIWGRDNGWFCYADAKGEKKVEKEDIITYATVEVFMAYYLDFMSRAGCTSSSITFSGHSLGAQTLFAITSYMTTLYKNGLITREFMPDRCVYLDAYLDANQVNLYVPWLRSNVGEEGIFGLAKDAVDAAREIGIATIYVKSSDIVSFLIDKMPKLFGGTGETCWTLYDKMVYVGFDTQYTGNPSEQHTASSSWVFDNVDKYIYDTAGTSGNELVCNFAAPISYSYARNGTRYLMKDNRTSNYDDDIFYAEKYQSAKIAGFAFKDANGNGVNDDRLMSRVCGVKVQLYCDGACIEETTTGISGYYEFAIPESGYGKTYTVKAILPNGMTFGKESTGDYMTNGINGEGVSAAVKIVSVSDLKIINIGINK